MKPEDRAKGWGIAGPRAPRRVWSAGDGGGVESRHALILGFGYRQAMLAD